MDASCASLRVGSAGNPDKYFKTFSRPMNLSSSTEVIPSFSCISGHHRVMLLADMNSCNDASGGTDSSIEMLRFVGSVSDIVVCMSCMT